VVVVVGGIRRRVEWCERYEKEDKDGGREGGCLRNAFVLFALLSLKVKHIEVGRIPSCNLFHPLENVHFKSEKEYLHQEHQQHQKDNIHKKHGKKKRRKAAL